MQFYTKVHGSEVMMTAKIHLEAFLPSVIEKRLSTLAT